MRYACKVKETKILTADIHCAYRGTLQSSLTLESDAEIEEIAIYGWTQLKNGAELIARSLASLQKQNPLVLFLVLLLSEVPYISK